MLGGMRTSRVVSITLPPALFEQAQSLAKAESRTMSELVREALRQYQQEKLFARARTHHGYGCRSDRRTKRGGYCPHRSRISPWEYGSRHGIGARAGINSVD
jgi:hypothetical protein